ncbi:lipid droplet-associated protein [Gordonia sp. zg691]|uniref:lipid droplet-associated protein n=1 Tax=Gordonia jinghuaiqii TaxID=2758710 RepID=UPI0016624873|nr:lipid droplet-associated protein [Gordonia jinghuaiqii]MBD0862024.1 lipid droplet-associated protein [Gordonia jinghuaiqii]
MDRAPYPARIAAGLIVTALEETRKLPALLITLPMTAVSQTLQAGMRAQQNIAELAIKGDAALEMLFDKPDEQPEWARFDEDELEGPGDAAAAEPVENVEPIKKAQPVDKAQPTPTTLDDEIAEAADGDSRVELAGAEKGTATKAPAKKSPKKSPAKKSAADTAAADKAAPDEALAAPPRADAGRFALYSSAPDELVSEVPAAGVSVGSSNGQAPEIVEFIDYDSLTLAQLRARLRSVSTSDLETLVGYERGNRNRAPFVTMLENRITSQNKRSTEA